MRFSGLGGDDDLCSILGGLQGNGLANASASTGDVKNLPREFAETREREIIGEGSRVQVCNRQ